VAENMRLKGELCSNREKVNTLMKSVA